MHVCMCVPVLRSSFYYAWPRALSIIHYYSNKDPVEGRVEHNFLHFSAVFFFLWNLHSRVSGMAYMKEDYHYSACYMFSESLCAHISFTHWVKIQVKKCKRDLWPSIYCNSVCSCQKYLVFLQAWKTHEKQLYR